MLRALVFIFSLFPALAGAEEVAVLPDSGAMLAAINNANTSPPNH